jgi:hypothetical protein
MLTYPPKYLLGKVQECYDDGFSAVSTSYICGVSVQKLQELGFYLDFVPTGATGFPPE